jgi:hypothetical protein
MNPHEDEGDFRGAAVIRHEEILTFRGIERAYSTTGEKAALAMRSCRAQAIF